MNFYKSFIALCLALLVSVLFACQSTGLKIGSLDVGAIVNQGAKVFNASNIGLDEEIQFGENMSAVLLGTRPLYDDKALNQYVSQVGSWLALNSSRPELPWHFGVINSSAINAFAAPGGFVFITSGMLRQLNNEAQLAAVLAHEIIHVSKQHHLNAIKSEAYRSAVTQSLFISAEAYQGNTNASDKDKQYRFWAQKVTGMAQDLYSKGLDREDELQADALALMLLAKSGYDPYALVDNLQLLDAIAADDSALALMYQTHPTPEQRLFAIEAELTKLPYGSGKDSGTGSGKLLAQRFSQHIN